MSAYPDLQSATAWLADICATPYLHPGTRERASTVLAALDRLAAAEALTPASLMDLHAEAVERAEAAEAQRDTLAEAAERLRHGASGTRGGVTVLRDRYVALMDALAAVTPTEAKP